MPSVIIPNLRERIDLKLAEAGFFLQKLSELENVHEVQLERDRQVFRFYASAFLNAVQVPPQYILDSVKVAHPLDPNMAIVPVPIQTWYDAEVINNALLSFIALDRNYYNHSVSTSHVAEMVRKFDIEFGDALKAEWREYSGADKSVVPTAGAMLSAVRDLVCDARSKGFIS